MEFIFRMLLTSFVITGCHMFESNQQLLQGPCNYLDTINITSGHVDQNGNFHHNGTIFKEGMFAQYDYILENSTTKIRVEPHIRGCICGIKPCIRLCCTAEQNNNSACVSTKTLMVPTNEEDEEIDLMGKTYGILIGRPCGKMYKLEPQEYPVEDGWIFSKGSIVMPDGKKAGHQEYCFGQTKNESDGVTTDVLFCFVEPDDVRLTLYPIGMIFSLPFLLITFFVYGFIPELRNLHGKSLMCYVFGLAILYISLSVVQLEGETFQPETLPCIFSGYMIYISVLLCFFWLNVMCYDIWSTFRGMRGRGSDRRRFMLYSFYAFGVPFAFTALVYLFDNMDFLPKQYRPQMGEKRCWMQRNRLIEAIYTYIPISVILSVNISLYSITALKIYKVQKETSVIRNGDSQKHSRDADKDRFFLYLRLFIVMGATWSMESISWVFDSPYLFYASDILNCLQGFIIFILFVWKPKVKKMIIKRYRSIRNLPPTVSSQMHSAGSMRTETSRVSTGVHHGVREKAEKPMLDAK